MRECNAAWAALGTPAARATYDDQLRRDGLLPARAGPTAAGTGAGAGTGAAAGSTAGARSGSTVVGRVPSPTEHLVEPSRDFGILAPARHTGRWVALGVVVLVIVVGVIAAIVSVQDHKLAPADPEVHTSSVEVGSCVTILPGPAVLKVPCTQPNAGQVVATTDYPRPCPTGTETLSLVDDNLNLCLRT